MVVTVIGGGGRRRRHRRGGTWASGSSFMRWRQTKYRPGRGSKKRTRSGKIYG